MGNQLNEAFDRVSIVELAAALGIELQEGAGQKNPFRNDKSAGSFSVQKKAFKDFANDEHRGGHIAFVRFARPNWDKKEAIEFIIKTAGMEPEKQPSSRVNAAKKLKRADLYRQAKAKREELPGLDVTPAQWSKPIRERWERGKQPLLDLAPDLAGSRGWIDDALYSLADAGKTSLPLLPWTDRENGNRGWAWIVERPDPIPGSAGRALSLVPVGFHARYEVFQTLESGEKEKSKRWVYVPYQPGEGKIKTEFQKHLAAIRYKLPAYPFVLGDLKEPRLVVILEGQFDAASFALAFGWLQNGFPRGVAVFGLRGVMSQAPFLAGYGAWLRACKPFVWVVGDNDKAGRTLDHANAAGDILAEPSFLDRIRAQGCPVHACTVDYDGCKDFNDLWRIVPPSVDTMKKWAAHIGAPLEGIQ